MANVGRNLEEASDVLKYEYFALRLDPHTPRNHADALDAAQKSLTDPQRGLLKGYNLSAYLRDQYLAIVYGDAFKTLKDQNPESSNESLHHQAIELLKLTDEYQSMVPADQERFSSGMLAAEAPADMRSVCLPSAADPKVDEGIHTFRNVLRQGLQDKGMTLPPDCPDAFPPDPDQAVHDIVLRLQQLLQGPKGTSPQDFLKGIENFLSAPEVQALGSEPLETAPALVIAASPNPDPRQPAMC